MNNGLDKYNKLNLYPKSIGEVSSTDMSVIAAQHGYASHELGSMYHI